MKTPPLLIGAAILFWGLTMHQLVLAALMAFGVEASRWIKHRWELNESDFKRASTLCTMALIGLAFYQFLTGWLNHPAWMVFQWLPAVLLPLLLAQVYSTAGRIDPRVLFLLRKKQILSAHSKNKPIDFSFIYLAACVFSTGFVNQRSGLFYIGLLGLSVWALWSYRPRHSPWAFWMILLLIAGGAGYLGQIGLAKLQTVVEQKTTHFFLPAVILIENTPKSATFRMRNCPVVSFFVPGRVDRINVPCCCEKPHMIPSGRFRPSGACLASISTGYTKAPIRMTGNWRPQQGLQGPARLHSN